MTDVERQKVERRKRPRRVVSAQEKVQIVRERLVDGLPVGEICRRHELVPSAIYRYLEDFRAGRLGSTSSITPREAPAASPASLQSARGELEHLRQMITELIRENVELRLALRRTLPPSPSP